jgi:exo-beta-1,3-glucanase (GH17 family)
MSVGLKLTFTLSFLLVISCTNNSSNKDLEKKNMQSIEEIKKQLENNITVEKQEPFIERKFNPYLNGEWIGEAISYGPYRKGQAPGKNGPSEEEILEDLNILKNYWKLIRVYGSDPDSERILKVIKENNLPIRVMLGVWLENETDHPERKPENIEQVLTSIKLGNEYSDILAAISVGNESQVFWSWHRMQMDNLIKYIRQVRNNTSVPVTTADDYNFWNKPDSRLVADEIDFIVTHAYSLWNGKTLDNAISWMDSVYFDIVETFSDKEIVVGETGWATTYNPELTGPGEQGTLVKGEVGIDAQERFITELSEWTNKNRVTTFLFEAFDEPWKGGGEESSPNEIEKHWGVFYEDRTPKESFKNFLMRTKSLQD